MLDGVGVPGRRAAAVSHVLLAMGVAESDARGALRVTLGHTSTRADADAFIAALPAAIERARRAREATVGALSTTVVRPSVAVGAVAPVTVAPAAGLRLPLSS